MRDSPHVSSQAQNGAEENESVALGKSLGLSGSALVNFVREERERDARDQREQRERDFHLKMKQLELESQRQTPRDSGVVFEKVKLQMPLLDDKDDLESFLGQFERLASLQNWGRENWAVRLGTLLRGKARDVYVGMSDADSRDYDLVKKALMHLFQLNAEAYRKKLRSAQRETGESFRQYSAKLRLWCGRWLELSGRK